MPAAEIAHDKAERLGEEVDPGMGARDAGVVEPESAWLSRPMRKGRFFGRMITSVPTFPPTGRN